MSIFKMITEKKESIRNNKEEVLALHVVRHLESLDYDVYKEVCKKGGGSDRADIYAVHNKGANIGATVAIEVKMTFGLKVIEQAYDWKRFANFVYVAVPVGKRKDRKFGYFLCKTLGIGVIEIEERRGFATIKVAAPFNTNITKPRLYDEQKFSSAGNANNEYVTPFKMTVSRLYEYLKNNGRMSVSEAISGIDHHYKSHISACNAIIKYIEKGQLPMLKLLSHGHKRLIEINKPI